MIIAFEKHFQVFYLFIFFSKGTEVSGSKLRRLNLSQEAFGTLQDHENNV